MKLTSLVVLAALMASCAPQGCPPTDEPHYDDDTGLQGVSIPEGSLVGSWGLVVEFALIIRVAVVGDRNGGSQGIRLLTRTWDADRKVYRETFTWCRNDVFEVEGTKSVTPQSTLEILTNPVWESTVNHDTGEYVTTNIIDLWGLHNMPDELNTELPTHENYDQPPQSDWVYDEDNDGKPGVTANLMGGINAEVNIVTRSVYVLDGTITSADKVTGLNRIQKSQQHTIKSDNRLAEGESNNRPDPDPKNSWFDAVRLRDGATCDDVIAAYNDGRLHTRRPF